MDNHATNNIKPDPYSTANIADQPTRTAIERTSSWKPSHNRRQSWNKEEQKHALQMTGMEGIQSGHHGFTERT